MIVPVTGPHPFASTTEYSKSTPAETPANTPVVFDVELNEYVCRPVPPVATMVTSATPPLQSIASVIVAEVISTAVGSVTVIVPVTGPHPFASTTEYSKSTPAETPANTPVVFDVELNEYVCRPVPPVATMVTSATPPLQSIASVIVAEVISTAVGSVIVTLAVALHPFESVTVTS